MCVPFPIQGKDDVGRQTEEMKVEMGGRHLTGAPGGTASPHLSSSCRTSHRDRHFSCLCRGHPGLGDSSEMGKCKCRPHPVVSQQLFWKIKTQAVYRFRKLACFMGTATERKHSRASGRPPPVVFTGQQGLRENGTVSKYLKDRHVARD